MESNQGPEKRRKKKVKRPFPYGKVVIDYETTGLQPYDGARAFLVGLQDEGGNTLILDPSDRRLKMVLEDPNVPKIAHGAKFERKHSYHLGYNCRGDWDDTMAQAVLINEYQRINLDDLSKVHLGDNSKGIVADWLKKNTRALRKELGRDPNYSDVPRWLMDKYLAGDLEKTSKLFNKFDPILRSDPRRYELYRMETELAAELAEMEDLGIRINLPYVHEQINKFVPDMRDLERKMFDIAGVAFNPNANRELSEILEVLGLDTGERNKDGGLSTDQELLELLPSNDFVEALLRWRTLNKLVGTYLVPFTQKAIGDTIHGSFWQFGRDKAIVTGRLSSSDPNLQNIPGAGSRGITRPLLRELGPAVRRAIVPPPGHVFVFFDFKQIEMVIFSCLAGDPSVIDFISRGGDVYVAHGKLALGKTAFDGLDPLEYKARRATAKELILSFVYGMGIKRFAQKAKIPYEEAKARRDAYFNNSPATKAFMIDTMKDLLVHGFVRDPFGRRYHVPRELSYKAVNAMCQGPAATVMKRGILRARPLKALGARPVMTVHDELCLIVPKRRALEVARAGAELIEEPAGAFQVPIKVDVEWSDISWSDKKDLAALEEASKKWK